jgi:hypothetical protein
VGKNLNLLRLCKKKNNNKTKKNKKIMKRPNLGRAYILTEGGVGFCTQTNKHEVGNPNPNPNSNINNIDIIRMLLCGAMR